MAVCGDFNIAPDDRDIYDRAALEGSTHITEPERQALRAIEAWGLVDAFRLIYNRTDCSAGGITGPATSTSICGMRIDLVLLNQVLGRAATYALDRPQRPQGKAALGPHPGLRRHQSLKRG